MRSCVEERTDMKNGAFERKKKKRSKTPENHSEMCDRLTELSWDRIHER